MHHIVTRVVGVGNCNPDGTSRQNAVKRFAKPGTEVILNRVNSTEGDPNTIQVLLPGMAGKKPHCIGFLPGRVCEKLARHLDASRNVTAVIHGLVTEEGSPNTSLKVKISF